MNDEGDVLLLDEPMLMVQPRLAVALGLNQALFLQQIQYWLHTNKKHGRNLRDGRYWTFNSFEAWQAENFPFWSVSTLKRVVGNLERAGVLLTTDKYNKHGYDNTKWYSIDRERLAEVVAGGLLSESVQNEQATVQVDTAECAVNLSTPPCQSDTSIVSTWHDNRVNLTRTRPETNAEITAETRDVAHPATSPRVGALERPTKRSTNPPAVSVEEAVAAATERSIAARERRGSTKRRKEPQKNANTALARFSELFTETFGGVAPIELAKDRALMKKLVEHHGYETVVSWMEWMFRNWAVMRRECKLTGVPTIGMFFGFRGYLQEHAGVVEVGADSASPWGV